MNKTQQKYPLESLDVKTPSGNVHNGAPRISRVRHPATDQSVSLYRYDSTNETIVSCWELQRVVASWYPQPHPTHEEVHQAFAQAAARHTGNRPHGDVDPGVGEHLEPWQNGSPFRSERGAGREAISGAKDRTNNKPLTQCWPCHTYPKDIS